MTAAQPPPVRAPLLSGSRAIAAFGGAITLLFALLSIRSPVAVEETVESLLLDLRFLAREYFYPTKVSDSIVLVLIDDASLERYGRWPWPRDLQGSLVSRILAAKPKVLAVDIFYSEAETDRADSSLGDALASGDGVPVAVAAGFDTVPDPAGSEPPGYLLDSAVMSIRDTSRMEGVIEANKFKSGLPAIYHGAYLGHVMSPADMDGKLRHEPLFIRFQEDFYASLPLLAASVAIGPGPSGISILGGSGVDIGGEKFVPTDLGGRMRVNYLGGGSPFTTIQAADLLSGAMDNASSARKLEGKIVLLGTSAISTYDFMVTPFSARAPAVEKNAAVVEGILTGRFLKDAPVSVTFGLILASGFFLIFALPRIRATWGALLSTASVFLIAAGNLWIFSRHGVVMNLLYPMSNVVTLSVMLGTYKYFVEEKKARDIRKMFSSYVSPKIVAGLLTNPGMARLGGARREISVLFSDLRGFTTFSENRDPEEVVSMLNEYFKEMTDVIFRWDGTLDKFVGDEIMAFWGAPLDQPDHAELALRCALDMSDRLDRLHERWRAEGKYLLECGIGINTGPVLVGNIGSADKKMDYTAIGDNVNLGARVESLTRQYATRILITEFTHERIEPLIMGGKLGHFEISYTDTVKVKGKANEVRIFSVKAKPHA